MPNCKIRSGTVPNKLDRTSSLNVAVSSVLCFTGKIFSAADTDLGAYAEIPLLSGKKDVVGDGSTCKIIQTIPTI